MKIIIVGVGKLGEYVAHELVNENHEVTLIDLDFKNRNNIINNEDLNYICGNGLDANILIEAGAPDADLIISVMEKDEQNLMCCLLGKKLGTKHTIARIRTPEYASSIDIIKEDLGLSMSINPEKLTANHISGILSIPSALDVKTFFKGRLQLVSLKVTEKCNLKGHSINSLSKITKNIIVCAINRNGETIIPKGSTKIHENDIIHITGTPRGIQKLLKHAKLLADKTRKVMIIGGSATAVYLAQILNEMNIKNTIIELDENRCKELSDELPDSLIIHGDATNENVLIEEDIENMDSFVALNSIDEENIVLSLFAKTQNIPKIITKINHINLSGVIEQSNLDSIITPHKIATNQIVTYVRAMENSKSSSCESIYRFDKNEFELLEFNVKGDFKALHMCLKDINFKENIIIVAIWRKRDVTFPGGVDMIEEKDTIIVANKGIQIKDINDILEEKYEK